MMALTLNVTAAKKSMTTYNDVIKVGTKVYCNSDIAIYQVNLKTGKIVTIKDLKQGADDIFFKLSRKKANGFTTLRHILPAIP
jgi:hypothetical protein